ncbi:hypothetical protein BDQ17DRAFT_1324919 [Cyathus striatus]|nr:hypothetical protein BDQ17DRAFT_1324919 [Cyathus striatus]
MSVVLAGLTSATKTNRFWQYGYESWSLNVPNGYVPHECFSPTYRTETPDDARRHIDEEILRMEESIRTLKSRRNTHSPISRLPPELLAKVFVMCAEGYFNHSNPMLRVKGWIHITHVSRYWRTVACNAPNLWAYIIFHSPNWSKEMLRRSKMAPLFIDAHFSVVTRRMVESIQLALKQMNRIKKLTVVASVPTMEKVFAELPTSAPILQSLSLSGPRQSAMHGDYAYDIPEDFLSEDTSSLRWLELSHCDIKWTSPILSGLTYMKIHYTSTVARPTTIQLLDALQKMPQLQTLDLVHCLPPMNDPMILHSSQCHSVIVS